MQMTQGGSNAAQRKLGTRCKWMWFTEENFHMLTSRMGKFSVPG